MTGIVPLDADYSNKSLLRKPFWVMFYTTMVNTIIHLGTHNSATQLFCKHSLHKSNATRNLAPFLVHQPIASNTRYSLHILKCYT